MPENTLYSGHPAMFRNHPVGFSIAVLFMVLALLVLGDAAMKSDEQGMASGLAVFAIPGVIMLRWWLKALGTTLTVTNERVTLRLGLFSKHTSDVMLSDVRNVQVSQGVLQRMLGVGAVGVASAGHGGMEIEVGGIPDPQKVKRLIEEGRTAARKP